jgi:hypothetical protein
MSSDLLDKLTLLVYQAEQHLKWHHALKGVGTAYNPLEINQRVLDATKDHLFWQSDIVPKMNGTFM